MNVLVLLIVPMVLFALASRFYSRYIARQLGEDETRPTPAQLHNDGRDYVPTKRYVVFAHHFSAIAGAGPIIGPTMAILYGFMPAWIWVIVGGIFIGAVHDFVSLFVSMREGGRSMARIARATLGPAGFGLYIGFTIIMLVLVTSSFLSATAISLTSQWPLDKIGADEAKAFLSTVERDGVVYGKIGGIASTSVIIITLASMFLGWLMHKRGIKALLAYALASGICIASVLAGIAVPVTLTPTAWMVIISIYVTFAAGLPVWLILQPRDFINVQILYAGIVLMLVSLGIIGVQGETVAMPAFNFAEGAKALGYVWPMMFITVACGAISGFHALVAGGTTVKQIENERHARHIGYTGMLLESLLAICVLITLGVGLSFVDYKSIVWPSVAGAKGNPILGFSLASGHLFNKALGIPMALGTVFGILLVEGFVVTTLDAAVRLNRYLFEELWSILFKQPPAWLRHHWVNSLISVFLMWILAYTNAFNTLWPIFGTANQLLAALSLLAVAAWLMSRGKRVFYIVIPAIFMIVTTMASLATLLPTYVKSGKYPLVAADLALFALTFATLVLITRRIAIPWVQGKPIVIPQIHPEHHS